jgi:hypothetical protein
VSHRTWSIVVAALTLAACGSDDPAEGAIPGSCTDGFDNDANGVMDCEDPGCAGSPDCACEVAEVPDYTGYTVDDEGGLPDYTPVDIDIDCNDNAVEVMLGTGEMVRFTKFVWSWTDVGDEFNPDGAARMEGYTGNGQGCDNTENLDSYDGWRMIIAFDGKPDPGNEVDIHNAEEGAGGPPPPKARAATIRLSDYRPDSTPGTSAVDDTDPFFVVNSVTTGEQMTLLDFGAPLADGGEIRTTDLAGCYCIALKDITD